MEGICLVGRSRPCVCLRSVADAEIHPAAQGQHRALQADPRPVTHEQGISSHARDKR